MSHLRSISTLAVAAITAGTVSVASQAAAPPLRAHSIFTGGTSSFHVGSVVEVDSTHRAIHKLCVQPAPIDRPGCSPSAVFAPSAAGTTTVTATFADGTTAGLDLSVSAAATRLGGRFAVPGRTTCSPTKLYANYDRHHHRLVGTRSTTATGRRVALYNRVGNGRLTWIYATNKNGFARTACITPEK